MAKKKTTVPEKTAYDIAAELLEVRQEMNVLKATEKVIVEELKKRMHSGEQQDIYKLVKTPSGWSISDPKLAFNWAKKHAPQVLTVDVTAARHVFANDIQGALGDPFANGFEPKEIEKLVEVRVKRDVAESGYDVA